MFSQYIQERQVAFQTIQAHEACLLEIGGMLVNALKRGNKIITCGNGGSAAEAQHLSTELIGRFKANRRSLPALSLNADGSALTCIANDFGADQIFSRQLEGFAQSGDCLVAFTSSGNSTNIVSVLQTARNLKLESIALLGKDGGQCRGLATREIIVPSESTAVVQELHLFLLHYFCELIEAAFVRNA
jgi:D-sedoheptulose 7-phosphate isomerase